MNRKRACAVLILALTLSLVAGSCGARSSGGHASSGHASAPVSAPVSHGTTMSVRTPPYLNIATSHIAAGGHHR